MKIIGILTAWGSQNWIELAIKQGLSFCDELHVCVSAHSDRLLKYEDDTLKIAKKYESQIKLLDYNKRSFHANTKADILNTCLSKSEYFEKGNWIWILDSDEFYWEDTADYVRKIMAANICDKMHIKARFFYINTKYYLKSEHDRLFKIHDPRNKFFPTQQWPYATKLCTLPLELGMFHYAMLQNLHMKMEFWKSEYPGIAQDNKTVWLDKIYRNYDLNDEESWLKRNQKLSGNYGPWISDAFVPDTDGKLFKYNRKHPDLIEEAGLTKIKDYREYWKF